MANGFGEQIQGLLGDPSFNLGVGLLSAAAPSTQPSSLGRSLGQATQFAQQRQQAAMENQAARRQMQQRSQQREAMGQLQGLLGEQRQVPGTGIFDQIDQVGDTPISIPQIEAPALQTPQGQQEAMGLLAQVAPQQFAQGVMGQVMGGQEQPRVSTEMNDFLVANPDLVPGTGEFRKRFNQFREQSGSQMSPLDRVRLEEALLGIEETRRQLEEEAEEQNIQQREQVVGTTGTLQSLIEMAERNNQLQDTFLATGKSMAGQRRGLASLGTEILDAVGRDTEQGQQVLTARDRFEQLASSIVNDMATGESGFGTLTNAKLAAIADEKPSLQATPRANNLRIASMLEEVLTSARNQDIPLDPQLVNTVESLIPRLRGEEERQGSGLRVVNPPTNTQFRGTPTNTQTGTVSRQNATLDDETQSLVDKYLNGND